MPGGSSRRRAALTAALLASALGCSTADIVDRDAGGTADAGGTPDAGTPDAGGTTDAGGTPDAGTDAGTPDAGPDTVMPGAGDLVISEIMPDSDVITDDCGEWFELHNPSADTYYDLRGCILEEEGNMFAVTTALVIAPGEYFSLARFTTEELACVDLSGPGFDADFYYDAGLKFSNSGDTVTVRCESTIIDQVDYNGWTITKGASFNLDPDMLDATLNDDEASWCTGATVYNMMGAERDRGTPGAPNTDC